MAISNKIVGKRLQEARKKIGYKQWYVAEKIDLSDEQLSRIENGARTIYLDKFSMLCDLLDTSMIKILAEAETTAHPAYGVRFDEIAKDCSPETVAAMLRMCEEMAEIEKRSKAE